MSPARYEEERLKLEKLKHDAASTELIVTAGGADLERVMHFVEVEHTARA